MNETECLPDDLGLLEESVRVFVTFHFFFVTGIVVFSLLIFYLLKEKFVYLKKRSFAGLLLNGLGVFCLIIPGNGIHVSSSSHNPMIYCPTWNIAILATIPLILTSVLSTTLSFRFRAALSSALSEGADKVPSRTWFLASGKFSAIFMFSAIFLIFSVSTLVSLFNCPEYGITDTCTFLSTTDLVTLGFSFAPSFIVLAFILYLSKKLRTYPDPFHLLTELKYATLVSVISSVLMLAVEVIDPFNAEENNEFQWGPFFDYAVLSLFFWRCPLQIYKAWRFRIENAVEIEHNLDKVLSDPTGFQLLKQHLIHEFSVENILFIEAVNKFRNTEDPISRHEVGLQVYEQFLKFKRMNIGHELYAEIEGNIGKLPDDMFDNAYDEIKMLIEFDPFLRFIKTEEFLTYAGLLEVKNGSAGAGRESKASNYKNTSGLL